MLLCNPWCHASISFFSHSPMPYWHCKRSRFHIISQLGVQLYSCHAEERQFNLLIKFQSTSVCPMGGGGGGQRQGISLQRAQRHRNPAWFLIHSRLVHITTSWVCPLLQQHVIIIIVLHHQIIMRPQ